MERKRRWNPCVVMMLVVGPVLQAQQTTARIAVVNGQAALVSTQQGKKAFDQLRTKVETRRKEFEARQSEVAQLEDQLAKSESVTTTQKRDHLAATINEKKKRLQRDVEDADEETQRMRQESFQPLEDQLNATISKYAADNNYAIVIDISTTGNQVRYAATGIDVTKEVVALYDRTYGSGAAQGKP